MQTITLTAKARPTWEEVVRGDDFSRVQRLVHLAVRYDSEMTDSIRAELTSARARAYNDEIGIQARRAGCNQTGTMTSGEALTELNEMSKEDAAAIERQYNLDLAGQIKQIKQDVPRANRYTYTARLRSWEGARAEAKAGPLAGWVESSGRSLGFEHFVKNNGLEGTAHLEPFEAVCPVCAGIVARGEISLRLSASLLPPFHPNCPHYYVTSPVKIEPGDCESLWTG